MLGRETISQCIGYHQPDPDSDVPKVMEEGRAMFAALALWMDGAGEMLPGVNGRSLALAFTQLEQSQMWFNKALTLSGPLAVDPLDPPA